MPRRSSSRLLACSLLPLALGPARGESLPGTVADRRGAFQSWDYNIGVFADRVDSLFRRGPAGQRAEIRDRLTYARRQAAQEFQLLDAFLAALRELEALPSTPGKGRQEALVRTLDACLGSWRAVTRHFDGTLHRALGMYPSSYPERLRSGWGKEPSPRVLRNTELALRACARTVVAQLGALLEGRRQRLYDAVHALHLAESPVDLFRQAAFDRAFASLQASYSKKLEPGLGEPELPEFPVSAPFAIELPPRGSKLARAKGRLEFPRGHEVERSDALVHRISGEEYLQREAFRLEELHQLGAEYAGALAGKAPEQLEKLWSAYREHRRRWFQVP